MNNDEILESFVKENKTLALKIELQLKDFENNSSENNISAVLENLKIIKSNAHILDFLMLEKLCRGFEEIIVAVLTKNLIYTNLINSFLLELTHQIIKYNDEISDENVKSEKYEKWVIDCDRVAAGMILDTHTQDDYSDIKEDDISDENILFSGKRLTEMLKSFEDISIQQSRLKQQSQILENYDQGNNREFSRLRKNISSTIKDLESLLQDVYEQLSEIGMVNIYQTFSAFKEENKNDNCHIKIEENNLVMDKAIAPHLLKILDLFFKNSKEYGFENVSVPEVYLSARKNGDLIEFTFKDNGNGIDFEELRQDIITTFPQRTKEILEMDETSLGMFLFTAGMTPVETGLNEAWKEIEKIKGKLTVHSAPGEGTAFTVNFPKSLSSETGFTIKYGNSKFFIPSHYVVESVSKTNKELVTDTPKPYFVHRNQNIRTYRISSILPFTSAENLENKQDINTILIIEYLELKFGLIVDAVEGFSRKAVRLVPSQLKGIQEVEGIVIDENYDVIPVLNVPSLVKRFTWLREYDLKRTEVAARKIVKNILIADPSSFARHIVRSIYENNGFYVEEAHDGIDAIEILKKKEISLVISAVEMPRMNGLTLMDNIHRNQKKIPVILFPFEANEEEEKQYKEMGADFIIKKNDFDRNQLIDISKDLIK